MEGLAARRDLAPGSDEAKIAGVYRSFMDTARIEARGLEPLRGDLRRVASMERPDVAATLAWLGRIGVQRPFSLYVGQDAKHSDRYTVYFSQSGLGLPDRDYYFKEGPDFARTRGVDSTATRSRATG